MGVTVSLLSGLALGGDAAGDTLADIENLSGSGFNDILTGDAGANSLSGLAGDDVLEGGVGGDTLDGAGGSDTASYATSAAGVIIDLDANTATGGDAVGDTLIAIEDIIGSGQDDFLRGDSGGNELSGGSGGDTIDGGSGGDLINGGDGDDILDGGVGGDEINGGAGADRIEGGVGPDTINGGDGDDWIGVGYGDDTIDAGVGTDTLDISGFGGVITINMSDTGVQNLGPAGMTSIRDFENLFGSSNQDYVTATGRDNLLQGNGGPDALVALGGDDRIEGGDGNDNMLGGGGADLLYGGAGRDIYRGDGADKSFVDTFLFMSVSDSVVGGGRDRIDDLTQGVDVIDVSAIDADTTRAGDQAFFFAGQGAHSGVAGEIVTREAPQREIASFDIDGDGRGDFEIEFYQFCSNLTAADFVL